MDPKNEEAQDEEVFQGTLRPGYYMQIGERPVTGPRKVTMDRRTAKRHIHMMANCGELREKLGIEQPSFRRKKLNATRTAPTGPSFDNAVHQAVEREIARVLPGIVEEEVQKRLAAGGNAGARGAKRTRTGRG